MDWTGCDYVEKVPGRMGGVPVVRNTRVTADCVWDCYEEGLSAAEISEEYDLRPADVQGVVAFGHLKLPLAKAG